MMYNKEAINIYTVILLDDNLLIIIFFIQIVLNNWLFSEIEASFYIIKRQRLYVHLVQQHHYKDFYMRPLYENTQKLA